MSDFDAAEYHRLVVLQGEVDHDRLVVENLWRIGSNYLKYLLVPIKRKLHNRMWALQRAINAIRWGRSLHSAED